MNPVQEDVAINQQPHASWAEVYDLAYEKTFGHYYSEFTQTTLAAITKRVSCSANIVDFGAGTGRISIPLSQLGYRVTAVEPCQKMLDQLNAKKGQANIECVCKKMEDFDGGGHFDVVLCVFSVLLYILDESSLRKSFDAARRALRPGGLLLLDIPGKILFNGYTTTGQQFDRTVSIVPEAGNLYRYTDELHFESESGRGMDYHDSFLIRYWSSDQALMFLQASGFELYEELADFVNGTGAEYWMMRTVDKPWTVGANLLAPAV